MLKGENLFTMELLSHFESYLHIYIYIYIYIIHMFLYRFGIAKLYIMFRLTGYTQPREYNLAIWK
jgi:hypothetical protein